MAKMMSEIATLAKLRKQGSTAGTHQAVTDDDHGKQCSSITVELNAAVLDGRLKAAQKKIKH